jgi:predicted SnoaL-like aldol condensation-catalyzing enzyme
MAKGVVGMKFKITALAGVVVGSLAMAVAAMAQSNTPQEDKNLKMVLDWQREVVAYGHVELASKYMAADYIEHNPNVPTPGMAGFVAYYGRTPARPIQASLPKQPVKAFAKGDYVVMVWVHDDEDSTGKKFQYNTYDVLRIQDGKIQEHWDDQPKAAAK